MDVLGLSAAVQYELYESHFVLFNECLNKNAIFNMQQARFHVIIKELTGPGPGNDLIYILLLAWRYDSIRGILG